MAPPATDGKNIININDCNINNTVARSRRSSRSRSAAESLSLGQALADELASYLATQTQTVTVTTEVPLLKTTATECNNHSTSNRSYQTNDLVVHYRKRDGKIQIGVIDNKATAKNTQTATVTTPSSSNNVTYSVMLKTGDVVYATQCRLRPLLDTCMGCLVTSSITHGAHHPSCSSSCVWSSSCPSSTTSASSYSSASTASSWASHASNHSGVSDVAAADDQHNSGQHEAVIDQVVRLIYLALDAREHRDFKQVHRATKYAIDVVHAANIATKTQVTPHVMSGTRLSVLHIQALTLRSTALLRLALPKIALRDADEAIKLDPTCTDAQLCRTAALASLNSLAGPVKINNTNKATSTQLQSTEQPHCDISSNERYRSNSETIVLSMSRCASPSGAPTTNPLLAVYDDLQANAHSLPSPLKGKFRFMVRPPMLYHSNKRSVSMGHNISSSNNSNNPSRPNSTRSHSAMEVAGAAKRFIGGRSKSFKDRYSSNRNSAQKQKNNAANVSTPPRALRSLSSCSAASWPRVPLFADNDNTKTYVTDENCSGHIANSNHSDCDLNNNNRNNTHPPTFSKASRPMSPIGRAVRRISLTRKTSSSSFSSTSPTRKYISKSQKKKSLRTEAGSISADDFDEVACPTTQVHIRTTMHSATKLEGRRRRGSLVRSMWDSAANLVHHSSSSWTSSS